MTKTKIQLGDIHIGTSLQSNLNQTSSSKDPFHILILGNFSGNNKPSGRKIIQVDRDNFDEVLARFSPQIQIPLKEDSIHQMTLTFSELEDFEPDNIFDKLDVFEQLRSLRRRLSNPASFAQAAKEMNCWDGEIETVRADSSGNHSPVSSDVLDVLLAETEKRTETESSPVSSDLAHKLIKEIVTPHVIPAPDPKQPEMIKSVDESISAQMSWILHHRLFQQLEAVWRGLYFLVRNTPTDNDLKIFLYDVDKESLCAMMDNEEPDKTIFYKQCIEPYSAIAGAKSWSVIFGDYTFAANHNDIQLLKYLSVYAAHCNAGFVAAAHGSLLGVLDLAATPDATDWQIVMENDVMQNWQSLRNMPHSRHLALIYPRFLLRIPYGKQSKAVECFDYEEMPESVHENYLWGNAGFVWTYLLAASYSANKWQFKPGQLNEITGLPSHIFDDDGDKTMKPCAEILLTERTAENITAQGITPCWSVVNRDEVKVGPFISVNSTPQIIAGRWRS